jgi:arginyl-tRNA synthetase
MLSLHGNTAPYLQNAYVRIRSIFRKADVAAPVGSIETLRRSAVAANSDKFVLVEPAELNLAKRVCQFAEIVPQVLNGFRPNILANYLFELANSFHAFYEACPVLKSQEPARTSRLLLSEITARVLQHGLDLLGIQVPERM